ncbi:DinB family protein [Parapedobacter sp. DT-150]|uniref:DinB family protein n=1 Tax=Parapedobacter sp. DT-150 TaxID=3396162 RepID=UPI003F1ACB1B
MKQLLLVGISLLILSFTSTKPTPPVQPVHGGFRVIQDDKAFLLDYYRKTEDNLQKNIAGLSAAQLQYKPSAEAWSISQCVEHIVITEKALFDMAKEALEKPANPERRAEVKVTSQQLINGITDRSQKAEAPKELIGKGRYSDPQEAIKDFQAQRAEILAYIKQVSIDDMRNHVSDSPFGAIDAYHSLLFVAGHTARHTLQIEEVKANRTFPSK